ncbi:MAG: TetR/AcrR family transcriptional regulator [Acidimicrobiia bacterium]|nr:TetR/AcrR family transcriptional regulator [Acidimicrobiia bacterium]
MTRNVDGPVGPAVDGRGARRERNRAAVVDAMLSLIDEGILDVTLERAAARAGVSVRSVFRYFDGVDDLRRQTVERHFARVDARLRHLDQVENDRAARIAAFVDDRLEMFEASGAPAQLARQRSELIPIVADHLARVRRRLVDHARHQFTPELATIPGAAADDVVALLDVAVSQDGWDGLRAVHGRDPDDIRRLWIEVVDRLVPDL